MVIGSVITSPNDSTIRAAVQQTKGGRSSDYLEPEPIAESLISNLTLVTCTGFSQQLCTLVVYSRAGTS